MKTKTRMRKKAGAARSKPTAKKEASASLELDEGLDDLDNGNASGPSKAGTGRGKRAAGTESHRELKRVNKELQVRIRELELEQAGDTDPSNGNGPDQLSEESSSIIAMVKDLHGEIDAAYELKDALETDLATMKDRLAQEQATREQLENRANLLEAKAALGDQLREDISFVEEERNKTAQLLGEVRLELAQVTEERDGLAEAKTADEGRIKELESEKVVLEARVLNLEEKVAELNRLRTEVIEARECAEQLEGTVDDLTGKLDASEVAKSALELDVSTTRELASSQGEQIQELTDILTTAQAELADLRNGLERKEIENTHLLDSNKRAEREIKSLKAQGESMKSELELSKKALREIRTAAARTASRVRERYPKS